MTIPSEAEILQQLTALRERRDLRRAVPSQDGTLPADTIHVLIARVDGSQPVEATVLRSPPVFRPLSERQLKQQKDFKVKINPSIGPEHRVTFEMGAVPRASVRYLRLVRAARLEQVVSPPPRPIPRREDEEINPELLDAATAQGYGVRLSHTVPGYVTYSRPPDTRTGGQWDRAVRNPIAPESRSVLFGALAEEFQRAQWSFDGPEIEWVAGQSAAVNVDQPGVQQDSGFYPLLQWFEFLGVLFRPSGPEAGILNVQHYTDSLMVLKANEVTVIPSEEWDAAMARSQ